MAMFFPAGTARLVEPVEGSVEAGGLTAMTIHCWFKTSNSGVLVNRWGASTSGQSFLLQVVSGKLQAAMRDAAQTSNIANGTATVTDGVWHSVAWRKAGGSLQVWLDGAQDGSSASSPNAIRTPTSTAPFIIGLRSNVSTGFVGTIAEVSMWQAGLTDAELVALAKGASPFGMGSAAVWHYWPMWTLDDPNLDLAINGVQLDLQGAPTLQNHAPVGRPVVAV